MSEDRKNRDAWIIAILAIITIGTFVLTRMTGCSSEKKNDVVVGDGGGATGGGSGGDGGGGDGAGPDGGGDGGTGGGAGKKACGEVVTFDEVKPVLSLTCAGCHTGRDTFEKAKPLWDRIVADVQKGGAEHMPPGKQLSDAQLALFAKWKADGFLNVGECDGTQTGGGEPPRPAKMGFADFENELQKSISKKNRDDQLTTRWLSCVDRVNAGASLEELALTKKAMIKTLLAISPERTFYAPKEIAPCVFEIDRDELGISAAQWELIEKASKLALESNTTTGKQLKLLTSEVQQPQQPNKPAPPRAIQTKLPWMPIAEFNDVVLRSPGIYYNLNRFPATAQALFQQLGVDFAGDLGDGSASLAAFNGSLLSPKANRLVGRLEAEETAGAFYFTEDTGPILNPNQSVFVKPGVAGGKTKGNLQFAAGEFIFTKENGTLGFFLADAAGKRLDFADPNVVHDFTTNPNSPFIINGISCVRCHASGHLSANDEIRASILGPSAQLAEPGDAQLLLALYKDPSDDESFASYVTKDNVANKAAMERAGLDVTEADPISGVSDQYLGDLNIAYVAGLFFYTDVASFQARCLNVSNNVKAQLGQLAAGKTASHDQLVLVSKTIQADCDTFEDPF